MILSTWTVISFAYACGDLVMQNRSNLSRIDMTLLVLVMIDAVPFTQTNVTY
jgi:hypothetical protein